MRPRKSILDSSFRYTSAAATDVAATFRRIRREQKAAAEAASRNAAEAAEKVKPITERKRSA